MEEGESGNGAAGETVNGARLREPARVKKKVRFYGVVALCML
jgi:hypothetical protein